MKWNGPGVAPDGRLDLVEVVLVAGGEVVEADDALAQLEQSLEQVRADEAGHAGDQPGTRLGAQSPLQRLVRRLVRHA